MTVCRISSESSDKISLLSFIFAVGVVVIHIAWLRVTTFGVLSELVIKQTFARMAVPFFFMISGFFLACHRVETGWYARELRKRIGSLLVPYVVWCTVMVLVMLVETGVLLGPGAYGLNLCRMPTLSPLWYIRCLMIFVVMMPIIGKAIDRWKISVPAICAFAYLVFSVLCVRFLQLTDEGGFGGFFCYGFSLEGLFYFASGAYLATCSTIEINKRTAVLALSIGLFFTVMRLVCYRHQVCAWTNTHVFAVPFLLIGVWGLCPKRKLPRVLAGCSFAIFVMHGVVFAVMRNISGSYRLCNPWLELALGVVIPIVFYRLMKRFAPTPTKFIFGGR